MYKELKREANRPSFKEMLKRELGTACGNCGSEESVEYHHVVPIKIGGTNRITNIVPLCHRCHKAAHNGRHVWEYKNTSNGGCKPMASDEDALAAFKLYTGGEIGTRKCKLMLGYSIKGTVNSIPQFKKFKTEFGIKCIKNNIDILGTNSPGKLIDGALVGKITYEDGREEPMYFRDTGLNDVEYVQRVQG